MSWKTGQDVNHRERHTRQIVFEVKGDSDGQRDKAANAAEGEGRSRMMFFTSIPSPHQA